MIANTKNQSVGSVSQIAFIAMYNLYFIYLIGQLVWFQQPRQGLQILFLKALIFLILLKIKDQTNFQDQKIQSA